MRDWELYPTRSADLDMIMKLSFARSSTVTRPFVELPLRVGMRRLTEEDVELIRSRTRAPSPA